MEHRAGWARAKFLLERAFETCSSPVTDVEVGRVKKVGEGLFRKDYAAQVERLRPAGVATRSAHAEERMHVFVDLEGTEAEPARWYREALQGRGSEPPDQALAKLKGILHRAEESTR